MEYRASVKWVGIGRVTVGLNHKHKGDGVQDPMGSILGRVEQDFKVGYCF